MSHTGRELSTKPLRIGFLCIHPFTLQLCSCFFVLHHPVHLVKVPVGFLNVGSRPREGRPLSPV